MSRGRSRPGRGWWPESRPRLPGRGPRRQVKGRFGSTWWGRAWVEALEQRASLDPNRLPRGRTYARTGAVGELEVRAGEVLAAVQGSRATPYRVRVRIRPFGLKEWDRVLDALSSEIGHAAALLDGELPPEVAEDVGRAGLDLLPGPGELQPRCSCPDWADPCKHSAAVCYLVADELDADPFRLFLLRGRTRGEVLAALRSRRATASRGDQGQSVEARVEVDAGTPARLAWARTPGPIPSPPLPPRVPGRPTVLAIDPPGDSGITSGQLTALAADAAARAWALASGGDSSGLELPLDDDLARRAADLIPRGGPGGAGRVAGPGTAPPSVSSMHDVLGVIARRAGLSPREMLRRAIAWRDGGRGGLDALLGRWNPPPSALAAGRTLLGGAASARWNRLTLGDRQLRLGRDGCWYPFRRRRDGSWDPDGRPIESTPDAREGSSP